MPLYEYECPKDGTFERMQKFSDPPLAACPVCGGPVEKLLSAPAIQFKGTGWYITDYARKSSADAKEKGAAGDAAKSKAESSASKDSGSTKESTSGAAKSTEKK